MVCLRACAPSPIKGVHIWLHCVVECLVECKLGMYAVAAVDEHQALGLLGVHFILDSFEPFIPGAKGEAAG